MNKKITTFLASAMLATAFTAGAADNGDAVLLKQGSDLLTVQTGNSFGEPTTVAVPATWNVATLNVATWNVSAKSTVLGKTIYSFVNKATGLTLAVDPTVAVDASETSGPALTLGGSASQWTVEGGKLVSYFKGDSVVYLKGNGSSLFLVKDAAANVTSSSLAVDETTLPNLPLIPLNAADLNTLLQSVDIDDATFFGLTMNPEVSTGQQNLLTATGLKATDVGSGYVTLQAKDKKVGDKDAYVVVDTAYYDGTEDSKLLKLTYDKLNADNRQAGSYNFMFTYNAAEEELYAKVQSVAYRLTATEYQGAQADVNTAAKLAKVISEKNKGSWWSAQGTDFTLDTERDMYIYMARLAGTNVLTINTTETAGTLATKDVQRTVIKLGTSFTGLTLTTLPEGVYTVQYKASEGNAKYAQNNAYALANLHGIFGWAEQAERQDFNHMPAAQWVVEKHGTSATAPVTIDNREFYDLSHSTVLPDTPVQLYAVEGSDDVFYIYGGVADTLSFVKVADNLVADTKLGYKYVSEDDAKVQTYTFNYLHGLSLDKYLCVEENGIVHVDANDGKSNFRLEIAIKDDHYGVGDSLVRNVYYVSNGSKYLTYDANAKKYVMGDEKTPFFLKENNCIDGKHYYALVEANLFGATLTTNATYYDAEGNKIEKDDYALLYTEDGDLIVDDYTVEGQVGYWYDAAENGKLVQVVNRPRVNGSSADYAEVKVSVDDNTLDLTEGNLNDKFIYGQSNEIRTSAFAVEVNDSPLYRRFNNVALGESAIDSTQNLAFVENVRGEYLMDEQNPNLKDEDVNYVGIWDAEKAGGKLFFHVDTAWVNRGLGYIKPQYLISVARDDQGGVATEPCTESGPHIDANGHITDDPYQCVHANRGRLGFVYGKYMVNFSDSAQAFIDREAEQNPYTIQKTSDSYTRVGFVTAIKPNNCDSLVILTNGFEKMEPADLDTATIFKNYRANKLTHFIVDLTGDNHKNVTWSFRYVNPETAANVAEEGADNAFLFESNVYATGEEYRTVEGNADQAIAPVSKAAWLKMQNGCLVLTDATSSFENAKTGGDGALIFNVNQMSENDEFVTDNEDIAVEAGVQVIAGNGAVTIQGAAGKTVIITNILGKAVANTVLTSDNQTIAVPAGVVAVAVEGEEAVKAIVK